jgi:hypothetical protein
VKKQHVDFADRPPTVVRRERCRRAAVGAELKDFTG